ncbi:heat stress transcription factor B-1-like isoform X1 [Zingiber officinale]|uniref:heat stress transcription factor B-1-like isoform X1 n=1 Tax=Zingiber officinale TaxID=94328 RepID=UPI001C4CDADF|nr:heat stress transcription factor B-1-like isoform X1 [Zingiber officinale]
MMEDDDPISCDVLVQGHMKKKGGGGGPAPFLVKTHRMVEDEATDEVISWGAKGTSFVVWKPGEFARALLPVSFKHSNFSSFVRQLNTYQGFRKVVPDKWEFANDNFRRGEERLLCHIRRRKAKYHKSSARLRPTLSTSHEVHSSSSASSFPPPDRRDHLLELAGENEKLRSDNYILSSELAGAKSQCRQMLGCLSGLVDLSQLDFSALIQPNSTETEDHKSKAAAGKEGLKLFGTFLERGRSEEGVDVRETGVGERSTKTGFGSPWIGVSTTVQHAGGKVCN